MREKARVKGQWLVRLPAGMSAREAMAIGTAGYTAMLAVMALERHGLKPDHGPVVVTGAAGGVGSVAIALLGQARLPGDRLDRPPRGGRLPEGPRRDRDHRPQRAVRRAGRPLAKERWAGGIDSVGSTTLANLLSMTKYGGAVAACGLAGGMDLPGSVAPFILRGVSLLGIDSVQCSPSLRNEAWRRLESDLDRGKLEGMTRQIGLSEVIRVAGTILEGRVRGRIVVKIR